MYALEARGGNCSKDGVTIRHGDQVMVIRFRGYFKIIEGINGIPPLTL
jgi:hypothetical protein